MTAPQPPVTATAGHNLTDSRRCGCTPDVLCAQHFQALSRAERAARRREHGRGGRGTGRGRGGGEAA